MVKQVLVWMFALGLVSVGSVEAKLVRQPANYKLKDTMFKGYLVYDDSIQGQRPGVLVVHEWWGHNDYARKRADMLAELGYVALAVDMYGEGQKAEHPSDAGKFSAAVMSNMQSAEDRFNLALFLLKLNPYTDVNRIGAIGYCFGGGIVLHMARAGVDLEGVVSFHGSLDAKTVAQPGQVRAKILVCNGEEDPFVSQESIEAFKNEMDAAAAQYTFKSYPGAKHSFTNPDADSFGKKFGLPLEYNAEADAASWNDMKAFFKSAFENAVEDENETQAWQKHRALRQSSVNVEGSDRD